MSSSVLYAPVYRVELVRESTLMVDSFNGPEDIGHIVNQYVEREAAEVLVVVLLDTKNHLIGVVTVSRGDLCSCIANPRLVFTPALRHNAASIVIAHNHPSGDCTPSQEDDAVARRIAECGRMLDVPLLDALVVDGLNGVYSFRRQSPGTLEP